MKLSEKTVDQLRDDEKFYLSFFQNWHKRASVYLVAATESKKIQFGHFEYDNTDEEVVRTEIDACECEPSGERFDRMLITLEKVREEMSKR